MWTIDYLSHRMNAYGLQARCDAIVRLYDCTTVLDIFCLLFVEYNCYKHEIDPLAGYL